MWTLTKKFSFEASHQLMQHDGPCRYLHGHSYHGYVEVRGHDLIDSGPKQNMVIDYADISKPLKDLVAKLDHQHLNDVLDIDMPTAEVIANWMFDCLVSKIPGLSAVVIEETDTSSCRYES